MFLKIRNIISKNRSKISDFAALKIEILPASIAASLASTLSPILLTTSAVGPTNRIPASFTEEAKSALSDRKPYPG